MIPLPYILLASLLVTLLTGGSAYYMGRKDGRALESAEHQKVEDAVALATEQVRQAVAAEISNIRVKNVYTTQKLEKETVEVPVYRDCEHSDTAFGVLNAALTAPEDRKDSGADGVPEAGSTQ